jgi:hypothetical protein
MSMLFLGGYPTEDNIKEGMMQRIVAVDAFFGDKTRTYLHVIRKEKSNPNPIQVSVNTQYIKLNIFTDWIQIIRILRKNYDTIYIHSIYNVVAVFLFFPFIKHSVNKAVMILDVHGIVPEETHHHGNKRFAFFLEKIERWTFKHISKAIFVSKKMEEYLSKKYPFFNGQKIVFNIYPQTLVGNTGNDKMYNIDTTKNVIIYSGNTQKWQNVNIMLQAIKSCISESIEYVVLTGEKEKFEKLVAQYGLLENIKILSLPASELPNIYKIANYGFILRDDIPLNNVASPTKLIEYLHFGIIPIVRSEKIGDFYDLGYEYIKIDDFSTSVIKKSSLINVGIAQKIKLANERVNLNEFVLRN